MDKEQPIPTGGGRRHCVAVMWPKLISGEEIYDLRAQAPCASVQMSEDTIARVDGL